MNKMKASLASSLVALAACTVGPDYVEPKPPVPEKWAEKIQNSPTSAAPAVTEWWKTFQDPMMTSLIERAAASNLDLKRAGALIREARAQRGVAFGALLPSVTGDGGVERTHVSQNVPSLAAGQTGSFYQAGFDAAWELDVFGGRRREVEAADAEVQASVESRRDVLITVMAEVARDYLEVRGLQARTRITRMNLETQTQALELTQTRFRQGMAAELDVTRAKAQVTSTASQIPLLDSLRLQAVHRLGVLLGREPGALKEELEKSAAIPPPPPEVPVGLPSELLRRRPDLRRAEREVAAATARTGVATAELYPKFFLTGSFGLDSVGSSTFARWASRSWSVGPTIQWSLFQGGRIRAQIEVQNARQEQAAIVYEASILVALREVEDALVAYAEEQAHRALLQQSVEANRRAVELATKRYREGLVDFLHVLEAQRALYTTEDAMVASELNVSEYLVALYKALGGGWEPQDGQSY